MSTKTNITLAATIISLATASPAMALPAVGNGGAPPKPSAHKTKGISKTKYIQAADKLCTTMNTDLEPAWQGVKNTMAAIENPTTVAPVIESSAKATQAVFLKLRALPRPVAGRNELIGYFNEESDRLTAMYNFGVAVNNEEPEAMGIDSATAESTKIAAAAAIASYGFKVCGL